MLHSKPMAYDSTMGKEASKENNALWLTHYKCSCIYNNIAPSKDTHGYRSKKKHTRKWKHEITRKKKWIQKYNEKRVWVEREESWECKIAPPSGNRIILWADGSSLCVGWHFPVTPSRVMLCDVCDWLLPRPWEATEPRGHLLLARSILGIVYFSSACPLFASFLHFCHLPSLSLLFSPALAHSFWPGGVHFQLGKDALVFFCETKPCPARRLWWGNSKPCC